MTRRTDFLISRAVGCRQRRKIRLLNPKPQIFSYSEASTAEGGGTLFSCPPQFLQQFLGLTSEKRSRPQQFVHLWIPNHCGLGFRHLTSRLWIPPWHKWLQLGLLLLHIILHFNFSKVSQNTMVAGETPTYFPFETVTVFIVHILSTLIKKCKLKCVQKYPVTREGVPVKAC